MELSDGSTDFSGKTIHVFKVQLAPTSPLNVLIYNQDRSVMYVEEDPKVIQKLIRTYWLEIDPKCYVYGFVDGNNKIVLDVEVDEYEQHFW